MFNFPEPTEHSEKDERDRSDSPWIGTAAVLKSFPQFTVDYIRDGISWLNLTLLQASIPPYRGIDDKEKEGVSAKARIKHQRSKLPEGLKAEEGWRSNISEFKDASQVLMWF